jgi:uncharacterized protein YraI
MNKQTNRGLKAVLVVWLAAVTCNLPANATPVETATPAGNQDAAGTSVALTLTAVSTAAQTAAPAASATTCYPMASANVDANIRSGPGTAYDIVGFLPIGGTAAVAGRNDANTWWYIEFAGGPGGHAWIAASVTTTACLPSVVQVVAAPALPTAEPTEEVVVDEDESLPEGSPDLHVKGYQWHPHDGHKDESMDVQIKLANKGTAASGPFTAVWHLAASGPARCTWNVDSLAPGEERVMDCSYTPAGCSTYTSRVIADSGNSIAESNEGNNTWDETIIVFCD